MIIKRNESFLEIIDYDKIDQIVGDYVATLDASQANLQSKLFLFSGGSASTVGALVRAVRDSGFFAKNAFIIDSEAIAAMDIIKHLKHDATLTKHAEKFNAADVARYNEIIKLLFAHEAPNSTSAPKYPLVTSSEYHLKLESGEDVYIPKDYVFSSIDGETLMEGLGGHNESFREAVAYMTAKLFELGGAKGVNVVIDDHLEHLPTAKKLIKIAKDSNAETSFTLSFVDPAIALQRAEQRFNTEGEGVNIAYRIAPEIQVRTHLHQPRNWKALSCQVDTAFLTHRNVDGRPPANVEYAVRKGDKIVRRSFDLRERDRFEAIRRIPAEPAAALKYLGYNPVEQSTSSFASFVHSLAADDSTSKTNRTSLHKQLLRAGGVRG